MKLRLPVELPGSRFEPGGGGRALAGHLSVPMRKQMAAKLTLNTAKFRKRTFSSLFCSRTGTQLTMQQVPSRNF